MLIIEDTKLDYSDVLIVPQRADKSTSITSRRDVNITREFTFPHAKVNWKGVPIISANMDTVSTFNASYVMAERMMLTAIHKFYTVDDWKVSLKLPTHNPTYIIPTFGIREEDKQKMKDVFQAHRECGKEQMWLCLDVPNGYTETFLDAIKEARTLFPKLIIIAGNVATPNMAEAIIMAGADIVKVGIGPGNNCETRKVTGIGYPMLSCNIECSNAVKGLGGWIIADGGCSTSGDIVKALASSDGFVMVGSMLGAHDENTSFENIVWEETKAFTGNSNASDVYKVITGNTSSDTTIKVPKFAKVYGMSSTTAMEKHYGEIPKYKTSEGSTSLVPYRGPLVNTLDQITGGLNSALTYVGATQLKHLNKRTTFIKVNRQHGGTYEQFKV